VIVTLPHVGLINFNEVKFCFSASLQCNFTANESKYYVSKVSELEIGRNCFDGASRYALLADNAARSREVEHKRLWV
jgi:hypothetical protein